MDKFEEKMKMMMGMSEEERMKALEMKKKMCVCPGCPSYNECAKNGTELLYCALGKSPACITEMKGCTCPACPITPDMGLKNQYFCTRGSEKEQREKQ
jgi:hypothetical protein